MKESFGDLSIPVERLQRHTNGMFKTTYGPYVTFLDYQRLYKSKNELEDKIVELLNHLKQNNETYDLHLKEMFKHVFADKMDVNKFESKD